MNNEVHSELVATRIALLLLNVVPKLKQELAVSLVVFTVAYFDSAV